MKTITIVSDDRVGLVADISYLLGKARINIEAMSVEVGAGKAMITVAVKNDLKAKEVLEGAGYNVAHQNSILIKMPDQPGELGKVSEALAKEKINIQSMQTISKNGKDIIFSLAVDNPKKASKVVEKWLVNKME